jgi:DNA polymerase-3 subunit epsilon
MREIVLDTETTGLNPADGHRVVEIGCLELENHIATGESFHCYINPERSMPDEAFAVHGLSDDFLAEQPVMADQMDGFVEFIADDPLIIHNAEFDIRFLNAELDKLGLGQIPMSRAIDTVRMARQKFPGAPASLDALCRRFEIDNSSRTLHGALLDAQLLAEVYLELIGGRQPDLALAKTVKQVAVVGSGERREPRAHAPSAEELTSHETFLDKISEPIWRR